jgi:hypothetical protein
MSEPLVQIQKLMEQHRYDEAHEKLTSFLESDAFTKTQSGGQVALHMAYMDALTDARRNYNEALDVGIAMLKATYAREREMKEGIDLARLNHEIGAL